MANHPQAEKRNRQRIKRQAHNRHFKTTMRSLLKKVRSEVLDKNMERAKEAMKKATPIIDRCAQKGVIPKKRAARIISRLSRSINGLAE